MKELDFKVYIEDEINGKEILKRIERAGRTCYKSEEKLADDSYIQFVKMIVEKGHESIVQFFESKNVRVEGF